MSPDRFLQRAEYFFLIGLALFLPALEAPKNICLGFFLIFWLINRLRSGVWGGAWSRWETLLLMLIASGYAAAYFAGLPGKPLSAGNDILAYGLVFLAVRRTRFESRQLWWILGALVVATLLTLSYGYWGYLVTHERRTLGLHSVGHVNHSAVYMAIAFCIALSAASTLRESRGMMLGLWVATSLLFVSVLVTVARGAIIPTLVFLGIWMYVCLLRWRGLSPVRLLGTAIVLLAAVLMMRPEIIAKTTGNIEIGQIGSYRPELARVAILAVREYPVFGVGPTQFGKVTPELVRTWQQGHGEWFPESTLWFASHAHNLYFNAAAERGLVGLVVLLAVLAAWGLALRRGLPDGSADPLSQTLWGSAVGAWVLTVVGGVFNTTLHHEHAMITALLIGLWMSWKNTSPERQ